ncbi:MAG TPA: capsular polysaccharide synthesis protein [Pedobacter sp.]|uniref:capsular polysaccharide synthesis protein n=1 Tax=Pedobacter sp. TaxID=1411316 RepID=UPI002C8AA7A1|nr:capsular polysaccharide synthesis protein [Pedobacter sp.]HMI02718.1 capsular polysaccharide synthesis protein [Pedobacter sp.]
MSVNNIVKSMWIKPVIGDLQILCINSFIANGLEFHLYTYCEITNVPEGVKIMDANEILDRSLIFKDNRDSYATFSDWFRIKLLYEAGGWWVDCDVLFVKKFTFKAKYVFATESYMFNGVRQFRICNAVLKMPMKSILGEKILLRIKERINYGLVTNIPWTEIGAGFLADEIFKAKLDDYIVIPEVFCPSDYDNYKQLSLSGNFKFDERTYAVHLWNQMWKWNNIKPLDFALDDSLLGVAKSKFS